MLAVVEVNYVCLCACSSRGQLWCVCVLAVVEVRGQLWCVCVLAVAEVNCGVFVCLQ